MPPDSPPPDRSASEPSSSASDAASSSPLALTHGRVLALAWPVVLAQVATAMTSVVDTAVMGRVGGKVDLAAVGVAAVSFSFIYWAFGFLRMSTTGLVAQAQGAGDAIAVRAHLMRALLTGAVLGVVIVAAARPLESVAMASFDAAADVETLARGYVRARIWGAPAALMGYAVTGWLLGTGRTRQLLAFQIVLNASNAGLDAWFAGVLHWGPAGIGAGTAMAEWISLGFGLVLVRRSLGWPEQLFDRGALVALFAANRDILVRTLALLFSFAWFVNSGAQAGTAALAGNEILLQFISVSAFVLDAFAFVAEKEIGEAVGMRSLERFRGAMTTTTQLAFGFGVAFSVVFVVSGPAIIDGLVSDAEARAVAQEFLPYCVLVPVIGVPAWQLDGAFLGATQGRALRNAAVLAMGIYVAIDFTLAPRFGNTGVWIALLSMYVARAGALGLHWRSLVGAVRQPK
ncbi:MAG: MATE family efflux transporter [Myxococcota bacterium]